MDISPERLVNKLCELRKVRIRWHRLKSRAKATGMKLNSVIFHTSRLNELRAFYEGSLGLLTGSFESGGETRPDFDETYVNYHLGGGLLCFESHPERSDIGTVVLRVGDLAHMRDRLEERGVQIEKALPHFLKIRDPEGRALILEP